MKPGARSNPGLRHKARLRAPQASLVGNVSAGACYVAGACVGALFFGQLTDRFTQAVHRFAEQHNVPLIHFVRRQKKDDVAASCSRRDYLAINWRD